MGKYIGLLGTLDTKSEYIAYIKEEVRKRGHIPVVMDISMGGGDTLLKADVSAAEMAKAGGMDIQEVRNFKGKDKISKVMTLGATRKVNELYVTKKLDGIMALGGMTAALMCSKVLQGLPFGIPKLMVSSGVASKGIASRCFGSKDISLMYSMVDFVGFNKLLNDVLLRSVGAICGMVEMKGDCGPSMSRASGRPLAAMSVMGGANHCIQAVTQKLEELGYEIVSFMADGTGDMAMEDLIREDFFKFVLDLSPGAVGEELFGGTRAAGPTRLEAAGERGVPQIVAPLLVNMMTPPKSRYKPEYATRKRMDLDALRTWIRLSPEELRMVARVFAEKLNKSRGQVKFLVPLQGWNHLDKEGSPIYEPKTDKIFAEELKKHLKPGIEIREVDANIDDTAFAQAVVSAFKEMVTF